MAIRTAQAVLRNMHKTWLIVARESPHDLTLQTCDAIEYDLNTVAKPVLNASVALIFHAGADG